MSTPTLYVPSTAADAGGNAIALALDLALMFDAHVLADRLRTCRHCDCPTPPRSGDAERNRLRAMCEEKEVPFYGGAPRGTGGAAAFWVGDQARDGCGLCVFGRLADLVILDHAEPDIELLVRRVLSATGRPLLLTARDDDGGGIGPHITIAWDRSLAAVRALAAASPFLDLASEISLLGLAEASDCGPSLADLSSHLRRQGFRVNVQILRDRNRNPADLLLDETEKLGTELLVLGVENGADGESAAQTIARHAVTHCSFPLLLHA